MRRLLLAVLLLCGCASMAINSAPKKKPNPEPAPAGRRALVAGADEGVTPAVARPPPAGRS